MLAKLNRLNISAENSMRLSSPNGKDFSNLRSTVLNARLRYALRFMETPGAVYGLSEVEAPLPLVTTPGIKKFPSPLRSEFAVASMGNPLRARMEPAAVMPAGRFTRAEPPI